MIIIIIIIMIIRIRMIKIILETNISYNIFNNTE